MKKFITLALAASLASGTYASGNIDLSSLSSALSEMQEYAAKATFEVLLPTSEFPVVYHIRMASSANDENTLSAADYLIEWSLEKDGNKSEGFSANFPGHHYRYRDQRLQEYHVDRDSIIFSPGGNLSRGVQNQAQFCDLLPQYVGQSFNSMMTDSTYKYTLHPDTLISGQRMVAVEGVRSFQGVEALEFLYLFDRDLLPVRSEFVSNPGQVGEQLITVVYDYGDDEGLSVAASEDELIGRYPEVFEKFRESTFRLDNLPGRRLPAFTAPTTTGERYELAKDGHFAVPTVVAILNSEVGSASQTVKSLREAIDSMPMQADLIFAFVNNNHDGIESTVGELRPGEHLLMSARGLARDCGVTDTPVIIICDRSAMVKDLMVGFNNDIVDFVIQKTALISK